MSDVLSCKRWIVKVPLMVTRSVDLKIKKRLDQWWDKSRESRRRMRGYWKNVMASTQEKLSRGASVIVRLIPFARKENWRRKDKR